VVLNYILSMIWFSDFRNCHFEMNPPKERRGKCFCDWEIT